MCSQRYDMPFRAWFKSSSAILFYGLGITQSQTLKELDSFSFVGSSVCSVCLFPPLLFWVFIGPWISAVLRGGGKHLSPESHASHSQCHRTGLQHNELSVFWTPPPHQVLRQHCSFQGPVSIGLWEGFLATSTPVSSTAFPELETTCCWEDVRKGQG